MTRKLLNFPLKSTYFILRITRILFAKTAKDLYHSNAYRMVQGKSRSKFKILNKKPDRGKSVRKKNNNSRIHLRNRLWEYSISSSYNKFILKHPFELNVTQQANNIKMTSYQRRCDVITSHQRWYDVILTLCVHWEVNGPFHMCAQRRLISACATA